MISSNYDDYENRDFLVGLTQWDRSAQFAPDPYFGSVDSLSKLWQQKYNEPLSSPAIHGLYTGIAFWEAIKNAESLDEEELLFHASRLDITTLKGRIAWTGEHRQLASIFMVQYVNGSLRCVAPLEAAEETLVYPAPRWSERVLNTAVFHNPIDHAMTALQFLGLLSNLVFFIFLVLYWNDPVIRASSPVFLCIILLGSSFLYAQPWTVIPDYVTTAACHLRHWLLALGFGLMFGGTSILYSFLNHAVTNLFSR